MPIFQYKAVGSDGNAYKGTKDAASVNEVRQALRAEKLYPTEIKISRFSQRKKNDLSFDFKKLLPQKENHQKHLTGFTRQMEILLDATIPYDKALEMIIAQTKDPAFKSLLSDIRGKVIEGEYLADAMADFPHVFPPMYVSMVRAGEMGSSLGVIMKRLAEYYENQEKLKAKLRSAMIYPTFMTIFGTVVVTFMITYIVPKITQIFDAQGGDLPGPTQLLINISDFLSNYWFLTIVGIVILIATSIQFFQTERGKQVKDRIALKLPLWKDLTRKVLILRFCQTLGTLLKTGIDLKTSLDIAKHVVVNHIFLTKIEKLIVDVNNKGIPLSAAMKSIQIFPEYVYHVVAIGEEAARVDELLEKVAERMEMEVTHLIDGLTSLLQPLMILIMGGIIGFIALAVLLPMLNMNQLLSG